MDLHPNRIKGCVYGSASFHKYEGRVPFIEERKFASQNSALLSLSLSCILSKTRASSLISLNGVSINESQPRLYQKRDFARLHDVSISGSETRFPEPRLHYKSESRFHLRTQFSLSLLFMAV